MSELTIKDKSSVKNDKNPLGYEKISKLIKKFAVPSVVAMLVSSLYNIVDQIFIGQGVGFLGNAATNVAFPLTTICIAIALLIGVGSAAKFSLSLGKGEEKEANKVVGNALWMMIILGTLYCVLGLIFLKPLLNAFGATEANFPYAYSYASITLLGVPFLITNNALSNLIRADGSPKYSMISMVTGAVINTILDPIFIFVFDMGISGAALATVISQIISCVISLLYIPRFKRVKLTMSSFKLDITRCLNISLLGASNCLNQVAICLVQIVMNNSLTHYGELSQFGPDIPLSSFGVVMKVNSIFISFFVGVNQGTQPILGYNYGAKQYNRVKETYLKSLFINIIVAAFSLITFQVFPRYIISIFGNGDELYFEFATKVMRIFLSMIIAIGIQFVSSNFFASIGQPVKGVILSFTRQILFVIPLMLILPIFIGIDGVVFAGPISDLLSCLIAIYFIRREFKKINKMIKVEED